MKTKRKNNYWRRHLSFMVLFGIFIGALLIGRATGLHDGIGMGAGFLFLASIHFWNRRGPLDRFYGMSAPVTAVAGSFLIYGLALNGSGPFFEVLGALGLIGVVIALGYLFWILVPLGGPPKQT